jgi:hypothetical protein
LPLRCVVFVDLVPLYLEGALSPLERATFQIHARCCPNCGPFFRQYQAVRQALGALKT